MGSDMGVFVAQRGALRAAAGAGTGGLIGAAITGNREKGEAPAVDLGDQMGFLTVTSTGVTLFKTKRGLVALKPKITDEVIAEKQLSEIASSSFAKGKLISVFEFGFVDGSRWEFDVPRQHRKDAEKVAQALGSSIE